MVVVAFGLTKIFTAGSTGGIFIAVGFKSPLASDLVSAQYPGAHPSPAWAMTRLLLLTRTTAIFALLLSACATAHSVVWSDPSPHATRFVTVAPGVELELLDWGGHGPPLIFLAGLGNSAHVFDDFAPEFRDRFHVYGVTRRGYGASSQPQNGYDVPTLGTDLVGVLRELGLARASFVGHSIAGEELTWLAVHEPERVAKLVYLDAAYDRATMHDAEANEPAAPDPPEPDPTDADKATLAAYGAFVERTYRVRVPESELRAIVILDASGRYVRDRTPATTDKAIIDGVLHCDYAHVAAPALAIYNVEESAEKWWGPSAWSTLAETERGQAKAQFAYWLSVNANERDRFRREVVHGQVVEIPGGNHYVFLSHRALVLEKMRAFLIQPE
jgi:pimeloyl-ACP methyl ester carboxylesterase